MKDTPVSVPAGDWTICNYVIHNEAMRVADRAFQTAMADKNDQLQTERDRRYAEVNVEKEKALKIKETADLAALELARESQKYKEERNDAQREQTLGERGQFVTRNDLAEVVGSFERALKPLVDFVKGHEGAEKATGISKGTLFASIGGLATLVGLFFLLIDKFK